MRTQILTLCPNCVQTLRWGFKVDKIAHRTTTEKKKICENCKKPYPEDLLDQYTVKSGR